MYGSRISGAVAQWLRSSCRSCHSIHSYSPFIPHPSPLISSLLPPASPPAPAAQQLDRAEEDAGRVAALHGRGAAGRRGHGRLQPGRLQESRVPVRGDALDAPRGGPARTGRASTTVGGQSTPRFASRATTAASAARPPHGGPSAAAIWLAEVDQAILVLRESDLGPSTAQRIDAVIAEDRQGRPLARQAAPSGAAQARRRRRAQPPAVRRLGLRAFRRFDRRRPAEAARPDVRRSGHGAVPARRRRVSRKGRHGLELPGRGRVEPPGLAALLSRQEAGGGGQCGRPLGARPHRRATARST